MTPDHDKWNYRIVVLALALVMLGSILASAVLVWEEKAVPDFLVAMGTGALGALAGLLAPSPRA